MRFTSLIPHSLEYTDVSAPVQHDASMRVITVYTDGSCKAPQDVGGWAFSAFSAADELLIEKSAKVHNCTNNTCEIQAVIEALEWIRATQNIKKVHVEIFSDSQYAINGATIWMHGWKTRNWRTKDKQPVKNKALWLKLDSLMKELSLKFFWTRGHSTDAKNNRVDDLARKTWSN